MSSPGMAQPRGNTWFGHPRGLMTLFFTELWERFSYYGMRGILVLYLVDAVRGGFSMNTATAAAIYGLYTSMVYLVALPGGWIADNIMGQRNAIFTGGIIIACGHFSMAMPSHYTFYVGLVLIIIGTGFLKPNVSAIVGGLYPEGGARRDAGFSIFYMGINVGALMGPLICGYLGENVNWHYGFGAAGVGMVLGLIQYRLGYRYFNTVGVLTPEEKAERQGPAVRKLTVGLAIMVAVAAIAILVKQFVYNFTIQQFATVLGGFVIVLAIVYFGSIVIFGKLTLPERKRVVVIFLLFLGAALFWSGFEQAGSSMNLFAEQLTDRVIGGWEMPASWLQMVNPFFIIILAPVFGAIWVALSKRKKEPSIPIKFFYGLFMLGVGFMVMAWGSTFVREDGPGVSPMWLVVTYFLHTTGELCLSPVGLSSITKLSPKRLVGQMMGTWFMGAALGNLIAGLVAGQFETLPLPQLFRTVAFISGGTGVLFLIFSGPIRKLVGAKV